MTKNKPIPGQQQVWIYLLGFLFLGVNLFLISRDIYYLSVLPVLLIFIAAAFISLDKILLAVVFFTPLSVELDEIIPDIAFNLFLPTEPLLVGIFFLFFFKLLLDGKIDRRILTHPVTIVIYFYLFWMLLTSLTSTMPLVSLKYFLSRFWYIVGFYFIGIHLFAQKKNIIRFQWLYIIPLVLVAVYTIVRLSGYGLNDQRASNFVVQPFFNDHTSYGAMLVFFFFPLLYLLFRKDNFLLRKTLTGLLTAFFIFAIVLSYTRAAWLSLFAAIGIFVVIRLRIKFRTLLITAGLLVGLFFAFQNQIIWALEDNSTESSGDLKEHIQSMANITSDASNLERINRWKCAIRMFEEKPFWGWGPGSYAFQYAPFQMSRDLTIISTNFGDLGNAHSEYLGPLSESGVLGMASMLALVVAFYLTAFKVYRRHQEKSLKNLILVLILSMSSYFIHGVLNNFLDTDKASVPFWAFIAMIVAIDIYYQPEELQAS